MILCKVHRSGRKGKQWSFHILLSRLKQKSVGDSWIKQHTAIFSFLDVVEWWLIAGS